jgi:tetratricopeptide (TPR) repeat protein
LLRRTVSRTALAGGDTLPGREGERMRQAELVNEFKEGLTALQRGFPISAVVHLRNAVERDNANPFYLSYYGLALARLGRDLAGAEDSCLAALRMKRTQAHLYLNLAEVYLRIGQREYALSTLYNGLQYTRWDNRLVRALELLGIRRPPVLTFLDRGNFLNRHLGKLRHRLSGHGRVSPLESLRIARG